MITPTNFRLDFSLDHRANPELVPLSDGAFTLAALLSSGLAAPWGLPQNDTLAVYVLHRAALAGSQDARLALADRCVSMHSGWLAVPFCRRCSCHAHACRCSLHCGGLALQGLACSSAHPCRWPSATCAAPLAQVPYRAWCATAEGRGPAPRQDGQPGAYGRARGERRGQAGVSGQGA